MTSIFNLINVYADNLLCFDLVRLKLECSDLAHLTVSQPQMRHEVRVYEVHINAVLEDQPVALPLHHAPQSLGTLWEVVVFHRQDPHLHRLPREGVQDLVLRKTEVS